MRTRYDEGVRMASWGLLLHCITSAIYAAIVDRLVTRYSMRTLYCGGMFSFAIAMTVMVFSRNVYIVNLMAACTGFAYATVTTIPFMLVQSYHTNKEVNHFNIAQNYSNKMTFPLKSLLPTLEQYLQDVAYCKD